MSLNFQSDELLLAVPWMENCPVGRTGIRSRRVQNLKERNQSSMNGFLGIATTPIPWFLDPWIPAMRETALY